MLFTAVSPETVSKPTGGCAHNSLCWTASWQEKDESTPCRVCLSKLKALAWYCAAHLCRGLCPSQHNRKTGGTERRQEPDSSRHTGHPGQHCGRANTVGGWWERNEAQRPVILFGFDVPTQGSQVEGKLLTLFIFWMPSGKQKQRETKQVFCESWRNIFLIIMRQNLAGNVHVGYLCCKHIAWAKVLRVSWQCCWR